VIHDATLCQYSLGFHNWLVPAGSHLARKGLGKSLPKWTTRIDLFGLSPASLLDYLLSVRMIYWQT